MPRISSPMNLRHQLPPKLYVVAAMDTKNRTLLHRMETTRANVASVLPSLQTGFVKNTGRGQIRSRLWRGCRTGSDRRPLCRSSPSPDRERLLAFWTGDGLARQFIFGGKGGSAGAGNFDRHERIGPGPRNVVRDLSISIHCERDEPLIQQAVLRRLGRHLIRLNLDHCHDKFQTK